MYFMVYLFVAVCTVIIRLVERAAEEVIGQEMANALAIILHAELSSSDEELHESDDFDDIFR